jgi:hypothetical protein
VSYYKSGYKKADKMILEETFDNAGCTQLMRNRTEINRIFNAMIVAIDKLEENKVLYTFIRLLNMGPLYFSYGWKST